MNRQRVWLMFGVAWAFAFLISWFVYRQATKPSQRDVVKVVAAARELPVGYRVTPADLKVVEIARKDLAGGSIENAADASGRAVLFKITANEPVLESKLASKLGGEGLTAIITPGMRAVSVQVNETIGVAGFVQPGGKVDVMFTRTLQNGDAAASTILQNVAVLAYGRSLQRPAADAKQAPIPNGSQQVTVTLLVSPDDAEKLALAVQRGKIQLALRNPLDTKQDETSAVYSEDLGIVDPGLKARNQRPAGAVEIVKPIATPLPPPAPVKPKDPKEGKVVVKVFRGNKVTEEIF